MSYISRQRQLSMRVLATGVLLCSCGCASSLLNLSGANAIGSKFAGMISGERQRVVRKEEDNDFGTKVETPLLREYISVTGNNLVALRGVGLVTGLDGTGGDLPPSHLRTELLEEMTRRGIKNPGHILASRNTAVVIVTAYLPAMVREDQRFDVRAVLPPNSEATSLKGGWLLETRLSEEQSISGRGNVKGHQYGMAHGAILTALGDGGSKKASPAMLRRGSIPGGAVSNTERNLKVILRNENRGLKTSKRIENVISGRLHDYNRFGQRISMAEAKTDLMIELKVHPLYRNNFPRYQQMIRSMAYKETDIGRRLRTEELAREIMEPETTERAALQLEAIGSDGIPFLKAALRSSNIEVRFHAAQALAYLEDSSGVEVLKQAAMEESAFRVYALAALSIISDADGVVALRELLSEESLETRYGAVRALKENNPNDPGLGTKVFPHKFVLHAIDTDVKPAVHVVRYRAPEVVVFGSRQELRLPAVLNVGNRIRVMGEAGDSKVTISKYSLGRDPERYVVSTNLVEIIHSVAGLGASYPDVVQMLLEADAQHNLAGELGIDRLPQAGRVFLRRSGASGTTEKETKLGTPSLTPGLFDRVEESEQDTTEEDSSSLARMFAARDTSDIEESAEVEESDAPTPDAVPESVNDEVTTEQEGTSRPDVSEQAPPGDAASDFEVEQAEFREPFTSRVRRIFTSPFQKEE
ncbi:MAG: flagellar basal body P-ring protein FlgI [Fuerstiella sp.]|nr:flagellar basal body P-ring protein FlgI [Fuerstiella sp.]